MQTIPRRHLILLAAAAAISMALYLAWCSHNYRIGFPLDDAWIHQTYARNLALRGEWAFLPGVVSAGSTSPLWSFLLSIGYGLHIPPIPWTFSLGWALLSGLGVGVEWFVRKSNLNERPGLPWAGLLVCFEWHMVWASLSGMETLASALIVTLVLLGLAQEKPNFLFLCLLIGVGVWIRPDLITLAGPIVLGGLFQIFSGRLSWHKFCLAWVPFLGGLIPYLLFNHFLSGQVWPNTLYAKQAEYAALQQIPFPSRFLSEIELPLVGVGVILLPGWAAWVVNCIQRRDWKAALGFLWWAGYAGIFALTLPVTYQHGRYMMPGMPVYFTWGLLGLFLLRKSNFLERHRLLWTSWAVSAAATLLVFWGLALSAYASDVAIIETEMVNPAQWAAANIPSGTTIAAHDIGALGFFGRHNIFDMAGLISPQAIPAMGNEEKMAELIHQAGAEYLILTFGWYPGLAREGELIYTSDGHFAPALGAENTRIYRWTGH
ncbi:MAG TPA: hypothetical protein VMT46_07825 [Anaerolineaceae bacterium]|nr:hypothetical protein [Anaerolineaceae bacterium]